jgi:hypothetical protein
VFEGEKWATRRVCAQRIVVVLCDSDGGRFRSEGWIGGGTVPVPRYDAPYALRYDGVRPLSGRRGSLDETSKLA